MIKKRTQLIYQFGMAILFAVVGALSLITFEQLLSRPSVVPPFDVSSRKAIHEEQDIEKLRSQATFYFELGRELKRARYADTDTLVRDFRYLCFLLSAIFAVGGAIAIAASMKKSN